MTEQRLRELLDSVRSGVCSTDEALARLRTMPFEDVGFAKIDHHRSIRCGFPEVIYAEGKSPDQVAKIVERSVAAGVNVLATRASPEIYAAVASGHSHAEYHEAARAITIRQQEPIPSEGTIAIVSAGTSDYPVAQEACVTVEIMDGRAELLYDVGVAGIHRLLQHAEVLQKASVIVVVAGMDGALPSVVGGLVECPVIAVPTSVGYGASFGGISALLAMLNSCAAGVTVVNIDNGFGAGYSAALINRRRSPADPTKDQAPV
ncbi:MAG: nickel pincer cofactor biosynthesis protein LarB [Planctomycetes bacterium]|nr:nickel pincer cofactor biosynthesis protein LarB [Planctomycetota bacterium]